MMDRTEHKTRRTVTITLSAELLALTDALAAREERPRSWIIERATRDYVTAAGVTAAKPKSVRRKIETEAKAAD